MQNAAASQANYLAAAMADPQTLCIAFRIAEDIADNFVTGPDDRPAARQLSLHAIGAYRPRDSVEMLQAARIVSMSMTHLGLLRAAAQPDVEPGLKLRYVREALRLERATALAERALTQRQKPDPEQVAAPEASAGVETGKPPAEPRQAEPRAAKSPPAPGGSQPRADATQLKAPPPNVAPTSPPPKPPAAEIARPTAAEKALIDAVLTNAPAGAGPRIVPPKQSGDRSVLMSSASWTVGSAVAAAG
jgi:hypothetical protein